jgi:hypothetical protein
MYSILRTEPKLYFRGVCHSTTKAKKKPCYARLFPFL